MCGWLYGNKGPGRFRSMPMLAFSLAKSSVINMSQNVTANDMWTCRIAA